VMTLTIPPLESGELSRLIHPLGEHAGWAVHPQDAPGELPALFEQ
jgi:hypothetical protein